METLEVPIRFVRYNGQSYLLKENVANYIRGFAASEETDTRNRLELAAQKIQDGFVAKVKK